MLAASLFVTFLTTMKIIGSSVSYKTVYLHISHGIFSLAGNWRVALDTSRFEMVQSHFQIQGSISYPHELDL